MTVEPQAIPTLPELVAAAERAQAAYDWEAAVSYSSQALAQEGIPPETAYALLDGQAEGHRHLGDLAAEDADLDAMARLVGPPIPPQSEGGGGGVGDLERQVRVTLRRSDLRVRQGNLVETRRLAQTGLENARQIGNRALEAAGLLAVGMSYVQGSRFAEGRDWAEQAAALFRSLGDPVGEGWARFWLSSADSCQERVAEASAGLQAALELFRRGGDREGEARALTGLGILSPDLVQKRAFYEQSLTAYGAIGDRRGWAQVHNNLALTNEQMGLHALAHDIALEAVETGRRMGARVDLAYYLDTLARVWLSLGNAGRAEELYREGLALSRELGDLGTEAHYGFGLARAAHTSGRLAEACGLYRGAAELFGSVGIPAEQATCLAWMGAAKLALGDVEAALAYTAQAVDLLESVAGAGTEYPLQEIWWCRYQVLATMGGVECDAPLPDVEHPASGGNVWHALDQAREAMLASITSLSDDGLRRNYLNKAQINRQIVGEWLRQAARRGASPAPLTGGLTGPGGGQEQFRRMLDIGLRLNARREAGDLARFVVDQVVELTGAERVVLYTPPNQGGDGGGWQAAAEFSVESTLPFPDIAPLLDQVLLKRQALLRYTPPDASELEQRSQLCVPLVASGKLVGLIYADMAGTYGRFTDRDRDLLSVLANQAAVALENAAWAASLERRVEERTADLQAANQRLEERTAELTIVNRVGQGLAQQLEFQAIIDLVGDEICRIFPPPDVKPEVHSVFIALYEPQTQTIRMPYWVDGAGVRIPDQTLVLGEGLTSEVILTQRPLVIGTLQEAVAHGVHIVDAGDGEESESWLGVPIIAGDRVIGILSVQDPGLHRYTEGDVRLLSTLAASLGTALENARLFDETKRLLEETQQRTAELTIVNRIGQGLAQHLEFQAIIDLVGDEIGRVFPPPEVRPDLRFVFIALYDPQTQSVRLPYWVSGTGERIPEQTFPLGEGLTSQVIQTQRPLVLGTQQDQLNLGAVVVDDGSEVAGNPESWLGVPIVAGDRVSGILSVADPRPHRFTDSDVRLFSTLAASLGTALENARLFNETNRLLGETQQRTAELEIINSVQQALAAQLDMQAIYDLVGDKIRDIFDAQVVMIITYDHAVRFSRVRYAIEKGQRFHTEPLPFNRFSDYLIAARQPVLIDDDATRRAEELGMDAAMPGTEEPKSMLFVPLIVRKEVTGAISLQNVDREHAFGEGDVRLLTTLANSMSVALENARLFDETNRLLEETRQRTAELSTVNRISQALASQLELDTLIHLVGEQIRSAFHADIAYVALADRQAELIRFPYHYGDDLAPLRLGEGLTSRIVQSGEPLLINRDVDGRRVEMGIGLVGVPAQSYLGAPIPAGGETIGALSVQSTTEEGRFDEDDLRLLSTIAANVGAALQNARLYQETQRRAVEMAALAEIGSDIASTHEMEPVLERLAARTRELLRVRDIALYLLQPDGHTLRAAVALGNYVDQTLADAALRLGEGITGHIAQSGVAEIVNYPERDPRASHIAGTPSPEEEPEGLMLAPLVSRGRVIGVMAVWRDRSQGLFAQQELDFLVSLARQAAIAIESARLYAETERRATEMAVLAEVGREISGTLDLPVVLERIARQARELLAAATGTVYLLQPDGYTLKAIAAFGETAEAVLADQAQLGHGIIGNIVQDGVAERIDDTTRDPRGVHIPGTEETPAGEKLMVAPLLVQERAMGALAVWRNPQDPPFNEAELSFSIGLAQQAAVAIENARLFEAAQESQRRMADIIDFLPDATLVIDREGKVIAWNRAIEQMTGVPAQEMLGKGEYEYAIPFYGERRPILIDLVLLPDDEVEKRYAHIQRQGPSLMGEALVPQLRGRPAYLYATASALRNAKGEIVGAIETIRDISDRKQAEEELRQAKAAAESATQAKSAFLATMSHEIRTPMNAVIGMTSLLLDTPLNPDQREFAETIRTSGDALLAVINDILDFSKIEAGRIDLERQPFDLRECVERALGLVAGRAAEKGLELSCWIDPGVPAGVAGDEARLRQILLNLLSNAVKFTEKGEVVVSVTADEGRGTDASRELAVRAERSSFVSLHFSVRDTGLGIPPDRMDRLFQSFSQVDSSTTRKYGGTGLGLAISQRLAELMGGRMWAKSSGIPGQGSTFHLAIPVQPATIPARAELQAAPLDLRGRRVLIVDDNATNRRILTLQTEAWGMAPKATGSPAEALDWLRRGEPFDVAVLDRQMPEMDGTMLAAEIRRLKDPRALPLVMVSSLGRGEVEHPGRAEESREFAALLVKPIRASQLYNALVGILSSQPGAEPVRPAAAASQFDPEMGKRLPLRILLAEDNAVNQKLALRLLERMGYRADVAANGVEAIQALERQKYDLVFMDVQMPEMDGLEATRTICGRWPSGKRPRIVAMTANALAEDREACLAAGMDDYLAKPIRVEELVAALSRCSPMG